MLGLDDPHLVITCSKAMLMNLRGMDFMDFKSSNAWIFSMEENSFSSSKSKSQGRVVASPVAFTSHIFKTVPYVHPDTPALAVAGCLFDNLHCMLLFESREGPMAVDQLGIRLQGIFVSMLIEILISAKHCPLSMQRSIE